MIHELTRHILLIILGTSLPVPSWVIPSIINTTPPCYVAMDNFSQHKKDGDRWYSTPFYSGLQVDAIMAMVVVQALMCLCLYRSFKESMMIH